MSEYGTLNQAHDEEAPLITRAINEPESCGKKFKRCIHDHGVRMFGTWIIIILITAVATISLHYALKDHSGPKEGDDTLILEQCVSERSWFVALMLSIFLGPFGIDRFYLGYIFLGVLKLVTAGLGGIWWIVDVVLLALNVLNDHPNGCHLR